jgi:hypothetical protein
MTKKKDKHEALGDLLDKYEFSNDDFAKLLCRSFGSDAKEQGITEKTFTQNYYGEGSKFVFTIEMTPHEI